MEFVKLIHNKVFKDNRGTFAPLSLKYENSPITELNKKWVQSNISVNPVKHTLRGLHFQIGDKAQCKLIKVINGSIIDFVVDIRPESSEYMSVHTFGMDPNDELIVPRGYAHGFITLEDNTIVQYLVDNDYSPESEGSIYWKEVNVVKNILKRYEDSIIISDKDLITKNFKK
jgi:dTDP-4-dehydrorhamnose 3,5-epimerase